MNRKLIRFFGYVFWCIVGFFGMINGANSANTPTRGCDDYDGGIFNNAIYNYCSDSVLMDACRYDWGEQPVGYSGDRKITSPCTGYSSPTGYWCDLPTQTGTLTPAQCISRFGGMIGPDGQPKAIGGYATVSWGYYSRTEMRYYRFSGCSVGYYDKFYDTTGAYRACGYQGPTGDTYDVPVDLRSGIYCYNPMGFDNWCAPCSGMRPSGPGYETVSPIQGTFPISSTGSLGTGIASCYAIVSGGSDDTGTFGGTNCPYIP